MKTLIFLATIFASTIVMAGNYEVYGRIHFQKASTWVPANKVCQQGGYLYHKTKDYVTNYCTERDKAEGCEANPVALVQPMMSSKTVCVESNRSTCTKSAVRPYNQGTVTVKVFASQAAWENDQYPVDTYKYTVDSCGSAPGVPAN